MEPLRKHIEEIVPLTDGEYELICSYFTTKKFRKHQYLVQEGNIVTDDFWVKDGLLKAYQTDDNGKEHIMQFAMENWWITDYQAYFSGSRATLNVTCFEATEVFCLSLKNREDLCVKMHKMEHFFLKKSNAGYIALQRRILSLLNSTAKERYDQFLLQYPTLLQRIPKTLIASYLGVSRETLSRLSTI